MSAEAAVPATAAAGDVLVIAGHRVGDEQQLAEILEVLGDPGHMHFRVRWEDGHETTIYPGSDAVVHRRSRKEKPMFLELSDELTKQHVEHTVVPHTRTQSAMAEARAVGVTSHEVAKTVVVVAGEGYVRAVVSASDRLDLEKLRHTIDPMTKLRLATEAELGAAYPGFELGAVPPLGGPAGDRVVVDARLAEEDEVVLEAGTHAESIKLHMRDLLAVSGAEVADIAAD